MLTPFPGTPLFKHMKHLITETDWEKFDGYTPTFQHPNMTHQELLHMLGSAYVRFYVRPSFGLNYLGINLPRNAMAWLEEYAKKKQLADSDAFFAAQAAKTSEQ